MAFLDASMGSARGWWALFGVLAIAWAWTVHANVEHNWDGTFYPVTAFPMFSTGAPTTSTQYWVEVETAEGTTSRIPLAQAFDAHSDLRPSLVPSVGKALARSADSGCPGIQPSGWGLCKGTFEPPADLQAQWSKTAQARLGLDAPPVRVAFASEIRQLHDAEIMEHKVHFTFQGPP